MTITSATGARKGAPITTNGKHAISFAILKEYYSDAIVDLLNSRTVLLKYMNRSQKFDVSGQYYVVPIRVSRNEGHGHIAEGGTLPDPGVQGYDRAQYLTKNYYGRIKFSGPSAAATKTRRGSFLDIVDSEVSGLVQDMARTMNRVAFGDGTGRLCELVGANDTRANWAIKNPGGFTNLGPGGQYLRRGMTVAIMERSGLSPTNINVRKIDSVSDTEVIFTSNLALSNTNTRWIVNASHAAASVAGDLGWLNEPEGLASLISDENPYPGGADRFLGAIDRRSVVPWRSVVLDNGGTPFSLTPGIMQRLLNQMEKAGDGNVKVFLTTHGIQLAYFDSLQSARRFANTMEFDGGYEALHYAGRPIVPDRDCTYGRIYGCDFDAIQALYEEDYHWMELDGSFLSRMPDEDAYQATLVRYHQFATDAPNRLGLIADVQDD